MTVVENKPQISIERLGRDVVMLDVEHSGLNRSRPQRCQSGACQCPPQPLSVEFRIHRNDENFSQFWVAIGLRMDFCPAEASELSVDFVKKKPVGIKPRFFKVLLEV